MRPTLAHVGFGAIAVVTVGAIGAGLAALLLVPSSPEALTAGDEPATLAITTQPFADEHSVEAAISVSKPTELAAPTAGRITAMTCAPGETAASGQSILAINGAPILSLATSVPLWRGLQPDDEGADVLALQRELARLGQPVDADGIFGTQTADAVNALLAAIGERSEPARALPLDRILWLPAPTVTIASCATTLGSSVGGGDAIATLPGGVAQLRVTNYPSDLLPGARVLVIEGVSVPIGGDGVVSGEALSPLSTTTAFATALTSDEPGTVAARLALAEPVAVASVPPTAVYDIVDATGCVVSDGKALRVRIAGSQLGQTFIEFESERVPATIDANPRSTEPCR